MHSPVSCVDSGVDSGRQWRPTAPLHSATFSTRRLHGARFSSSSSSCLRLERSATQISSIRAVRRFIRARRALSATRMPDLTPPPPYFGSPSALIAHISRLRQTSVVIVEGVIALRRILVEAAGGNVADLPVSLSANMQSQAAAAAFAPYVWNGSDYLSKMVHDCDFVVEIPNVVRALRVR